MKKTAEIVDLSVISIAEGKQLGTVKSVVINAAQRGVAALLVDDGKWYLGAKLLPFSSVTGIGEDAVTVENSQSVRSIGEVPELTKLLAADIQIIGTKVVAKSGTICGKVQEFTIDDAGKIVNCEMINSKDETVTIPAEKFITFGKEVSILNEGGNKQTPVEEPSANDQDNGIDYTAIAAPYQATAPLQPEVKTTTEDTTAEKPDLKDDRQRKFLLGRKATRRIETDNGVLIVEKDGEITEEVLQKARLAGKFIELSMNFQ